MSHTVSVKIATGSLFPSTMVDSLHPTFGDNLIIDLQVVRDLNLLSEILRLF